VSIPLKQLYQLVEDTRARVDEAGLLGDTDDFPVRAVVGYGHMGDANLHLNVSTRRFDARVERVLEPFVYEWIAERQGSISAEHGLGLMKKKFIGYSRNPTMVGLMKNIKASFDPVGLPPNMVPGFTICLGTSSLTLLHRTAFLTRTSIFRSNLHFYLKQPVPSIGCDISRTMKVIEFGVHCGLEAGCQTIQPEN
jgi:hypothetical protein